MDCNLDKCLKCSKKSQCAKYPVLQVLNSTQDINNKINVVSGVCVNILDKMDMILQELETLKNNQPAEEKQSFFGKVIGK